MAREGGPWLIAAIISTGSVEQDNGLRALVNISESVTADRPTPAIIPIHVEVSGGESGHQYTIGIEVVYPDGRSVLASERLRPFSADEWDIVKLNMPVTLTLFRSGVHWFRFLLDGIVRAELPYRVSIEADTAASEDQRPDGFQA